MPVVKIDSHIQSGRDKPTDPQLVPVEILRCIISEVGIYQVEDARKILNSRFNGKFIDIVHETRNE